MEQIKNLVGSLNDRMSKAKESQNWKNVSFSNGETIKKLKVELSQLKKYSIIKTP